MVSDMSVEESNEARLFHDDFERCDDCGDIVLMHGRGECLELDDEIYCPRHARPHMNTDEWELRWGESIQLLDAIRDHPGLAIKYDLVDGIGPFYAIHREDDIYELWQRCEDDEKMYTTISESSLVRNIERRSLVGSYIGYAPHLVTVEEAPINADRPDATEVLDRGW